ncbi:hypothetical protein V5279_25215 [Bradyrhizobium sp. 26S5]|uniref:hypothetical protein n=1 Tax=Bradyrhizobium sp. 26S5 TaxID=3139729 RepID=UPI0030CB2CEA
MRLVPPQLRRLQAVAAAERAEVEPVSAAIMLRQRNCIHLVVDAASYFSDGDIAGFLNKCQAMEEIRCAVTTLGASRWQPIVFDAIQIAHRYATEAQKHGPEAWTS